MAMNKKLHAGELPEVSLQDVGKIPVMGLHGWEAKAPSEACALGIWSFGFNQQTGELVSDVDFLFDCILAGRQVMLRDRDSDSSIQWASLASYTTDNTGVFTEAKFSRLAETDGNLSIIVYTLAPATATVTKTEYSIAAAE